jgi:ACT domain-containing protein
MKPKQTKKVAGQQKPCPAPPGNKNPARHRRATKTLPGTARHFCFITGVLTQHWRGHSLQMSAMKRSKSDGSLSSLELGNSMMHRQMEDMNIRMPNVIANESTCMRSYAVIKASANDSKSMHVELAAKDGILCISVVQQQAGVMQTFPLARVVIKNLLICWEWGTNDLFILCMLVEEKVEGDIWCYTSPYLRSKWLATLQKNGACIARMNGARITRMSAFVNCMHRKRNHLSKIVESRVEETQHDAKDEGEQDYFHVYALVFLIFASVAEIWMQNCHSAV